ncbi:alanine racemase, partial [Streptomyces brasiliscabiei]
RLGLTPDEVLTLAAEPHRLDGITVEAWISHLASADDPASSLSEQQRQRFRAALARLPPAPASLANSAGLLRGPAFRF